MLIVAASAIKYACQLSVSSVALDPGRLSYFTDLLHHIDAALFPRLFIVMVTYDFIFYNEL